MCSLFTERHRGRNATFLRPSDGRKAVFQRRAVWEKHSADHPSHPEIFTDEDRGRNAERTKLRAPFFSGEGLGDDVDGKTPGRGGACGSLRMGAPASRPVTFPRNAAEIRKTDELSAPG